MPKRPIIRYHGGKWKLAQWIVSKLPKHKVYVEPFGGAASVLLKKPRSYAEIYNDMDSEIVNLFKTVRDHGDELRAKLELTPFSREEFNLSYEPSDDQLEQARRTVCRAYMGFGSNAHNKRTGFRSNSNRYGTIPAHDWMNYPMALDGIIQRLRGVVIENRSAIEVMKAHDGIDTVHYVDPPYVQCTRDSGRDYRYEMSDADHSELANYLHDVTGMVVISGYASDMYDDLYRGWRKAYKKAHADGARDRVEVLWFSPNCPNNSLF